MPACKSVYSQKFILGSRISYPPDAAAVLAFLHHYLQGANPPAYLTVNNVHTVVQGVWEPDYRAITNGALLSLPDGKPLSVVARWRGEPQAQRIFGPTFMEYALFQGQRLGLRHFFFGSDPDTLARLQQTCATRFPEAKIVGAISPPYRPFTPEENAAFLREMNEADPDIVWVGLGAPRQERWMAAHYRQLHRGVMIGIGAGFDYLAGKTRHAPQWMKDASLEWLYRLIQEPRRLWKRYLVTNTLFVWYLLLEQLRLKRFDAFQEEKKMKDER